jgi:hypothetical protein
MKCEICSAPACPALVAFGNILTTVCWECYHRVRFGIIFSQCLQGKACDAAMHQLVNGEQA